MSSLILEERTFEQQFTGEAMDKMSFEDKLECLDNRIRSEIL